MNHYLRRFLLLFFHFAVRFFSFISTVFISPVSFFLSTIVQHLNPPLRQKTKPPSTPPDIDWTIRPRKPIKDKPDNALNMPLSLLRFSKSVQEAPSDFSQLRVSEQEAPLMKAQLRQVRAMAKVILSQGPRMPSLKALDRTENAAKFFFAQTYRFMASGDMDRYPLEGLNKCIAFFALPKSKLVLVALSEDRLSAHDIEVRQAMLQWLALLNAPQAPFRYELVARPTKEQYWLLRSLNMRHDGEVTCENIAPRLRCAEVALMAAACKVGRFKPLSLDELGIIPFGCGLWQAQEGDEPVRGFSASFRNHKYKKKRPLKIEIEPEVYGYLDLWEPCQEHCALYYHEMRAISVAGTAATTFDEPRSENLFRRSKM